MSDVTELMADIHRHPDVYSAAVAAASAKLKPEHLAFALVAMRDLLLSASTQSLPLSEMQDPRLNEILSAFGSLPIIARVTSRLTNPPAASPCIQATMLDAVSVHADVSPPPSLIASAYVPQSGVNNPTVHLLSPQTGTVREGLGPVECTTDCARYALESFSDAFGLWASKFALSELMKASIGKSFARYVAPSAINGAYLKLLEELGGKAAESFVEAPDDPSAFEAAAVSVSDVALLCIGVSGVVAIAFTPAAPLSASAASICGTLVSAVTIATLVYQVKAAGFDVYRNCLKQKATNPACIPCSPGSAWKLCELTDPAFGYCTTARKECQGGYLTDCLPFVQPGCPASGDPNCCPPGGGPPSWLGGSGSSGGSGSGSGSGGSSASGSSSSGSSLGPCGANSLLVSTLFTGTTGGLSGPTCVLSGTSPYCLTAAEYAQATGGKPLPSACAGQGTVGCWSDALQALVNPCCPGYTCNAITTTNVDACHNGGVVGGICQ